MVNSCSCSFPHDIPYKEQYKFVYEVLEEAYICGKTWFSASELAHQIKLKSQKNPLTQENEYQLEYRVRYLVTPIVINYSFIHLEQKIQKMTKKPTIGDCAGGHRIENREKNRDVAIVPRKNECFSYHVRCLNGYRKNS